MNEAGWDLALAISEALAVLGFLELPSEDQPDPSIWHHRERLDEWFAGAKQRREDRANGLTMTPIGEDEPGMTSNEYARQFQ